MLNIQQVIKKERTQDKARIIAAAKHIRRSEWNRNIWLVGSGNPATPNRFYRVMWNDLTDCFEYDCKAFEFSPDNTCKHVYACALHEGGLA